MFLHENTVRTVTAEEIGYWKVQELKNFCKENKIKGYSKLRKAELIELVTDFIENHNETNTTSTSSKPQISVNATPLSLDFRAESIQKREYVMRKKLAEEKEYLRCWRAVLVMLTKSNKTGELDGEIDAVLRNIELCQSRIESYEPQPVIFDFSEAMAATVKQMADFRLELTTRKHRKAA